MKLRGKCVLGAWALLLASATVSAQAPPFGGEFQVNTYTTGDQDFPAVAINSDGTFVIAWQSYGQDGSKDGIFAQVFDAGGAKDGSEFALNTHTTDSQRRPAIAGGPPGKFVVVWQSYYQDGSFVGVFGRLISGNTPSGAEFQVNTYTTDDQGYPAAAMAGDGSFVVVWHSDDPNRKGIFGQRFAANATPIGGEFEVFSTTGTAPLTPSIAMDTSGNFVVVWVDFLDGSGSGVGGQRFDASGAKVGPAFPINTHTTGDQKGAQVAMGRHGDFVVVWSDYAGEDGDHSGVFGQRFNASAEKVGSEFQVNSHTQYYQDNASVAMESSGGFVVTWNDDASGTAFGVEGQRFDRTGAEVGPEFKISASTSALHEDARVASGADTLVATWGIFGDDGAGEGVFRARTNPIAEGMNVDVHSSSGTNSDTNGVLEPGESVRIEPFWKNVGGNAFARTGAASNFGGPGGAIYHLNNATADYGSIPAGGIVNCYDATVAHDCYRVTVDVPASRPAMHWDAALQEDLSANGTQFWTVHVGDSFTDVPRSQPFYVKIETLLHYGITSGCSTTTYCPGSSVPRDQMAIFVAKAIAGTGALVPTTGFVGGQAYDCSPGGHSLFSDVTPTDAACRHIHYLAAQNVTLGCNSGQFCPTQTITRDAMAAFIAKGIVAPQGGAGVPVTDFNPALGRAYNCVPAGSSHFTDVPVSSPFCKHINYLWSKGILSGCGATTYCPGATVNRDAMAKFIANGFSLQLYGP